MQSGSASGFLPLESTLSVRGFVGRSTLSVRNPRRRSTLSVRRDRPYSACRADLRTDTERTRGREFAYAQCRFAASASPEGGENGANRLVTSVARIRWVRSAASVVVAPRPEDSCRPAKEAGKLELAVHRAWLGKGNLLGGAVASAKFAHLASGLAEGRGLKAAFESSSRPVCRLPMRWCGDDWYPKYGLLLSGIWHTSLALWCA